MVRKEISINIDNQFFRKLLLFLDELRIRGYNIGIDQYINIQKILVTLTANNNFPHSIIHLEKIISPIVCHTSLEQKNFPYHYYNWVNQFCVKDSDKIQLKKYSRHPKENIQKKQIQNIKSEVKQTRKKTRFWLSILVVLILVFVITLLYLPTANFLTQNNNIQSIQTNKNNQSIRIKTHEDKFVKQIDKNKSNFHKLSKQTDINKDIYPNQSVQTIDNKRNSYQQQVKTVIKTDSAKDSYNKISILLINNYHKLLILIFFIVVLIFIFVLVKKIKHYILSKYLSHRKFNRLSKIENFFVKDINDNLFQSLTLLQTAQKLRTHQFIRSNEIDIGKTVAKSIERGGLYTPVHRYLRVPPDYLVLIDRTTYHDHCSLYSDSIIKKIESYEVSVKKYYFDEDPRSCYSDLDNGLLMNLVDLAGIYYDYRLIILSNLSIFIDPFTVEPVEWLDQFDAWENKAILTYEPIEFIQTHLNKFNSTGFNLLPANEYGLLEFIENIIQTERVSIKLNHVGNTKKNKPLTDIFENNQNLYCERHAPKRDKIEHLIDRLKQYLGEEAFYWLCACAVYPELKWNLTLYIGYNLKKDNKSVFSEQLLLLLSGLPWFRYGLIPDWLRRRLIDELTIKQEKQIRQLIDLLFITAIEKPISSFSLSYAKDTKRVSSLSNRIQKILKKQSPQFSRDKDQVFCSFMYSKLAVKVPKKVLYHFKQKNYSNKKTKAKIFKPVENIDRIKICFLIIIGMFCCFHLSLNNNLLNSTTYLNSIQGKQLINLTIFLQPIQILISFLIGYRYGKFSGLLSGYLIFLPNLFLHLLLCTSLQKYYALQKLLSHLYFNSNSIDISVMENLSSASLYKNKSIILICFLLFYLSNGMIGFFSAYLKQKLYNLQQTTNQFDSNKKNKFPIIYYFFVIIPTYLFSFNMPLNIESDVNILLKPYSIMPFILLLISFYYGIRPALRIFLFCLPVCLFNMNILLSQTSPIILSIGGFYQNSYLFLILFSIIIAGHLNYTFILSTHKYKYSKTLYLFFTFLLIILSCLLIDKHGDKLSMNSLHTVFPLLIIAGLIFGSKRGFLMGIICGVSLIMEIELNDSHTKQTFFYFMPIMQIMPLIAYIAGSETFQNKIFRRSFILFLFLMFFRFYLIMIDNIILSTKHFIELGMNFSFPLYVLLILYSLFCWFRPGYLTKDYYDKIFQKPSKLKFLSLFIIGIFSFFYINFKIFPISIVLFPVNIFISFFISFYYGKSYAIFAGFFYCIISFINFSNNNFNLPIVDKISNYEELTIGLYIACNAFFYSFLGYSYARLKEKIFTCNNDFFLIEKSSLLYKKFWLLVPLMIYFTILFLIKSYLMDININFYHMVYNRFEILLISYFFILFFYYGFKKILFLLLTYSILSSIQFTQGNISNVYFFQIWLFAVFIIVGYINPNYDKKYDNNPKILYIFLVLFCSILSFNIESANINISGYGLSVVLVIFSGYLFGSFYGFWFGLIWSVSGIFVLDINYYDLRINLFNIHGPVAYSAPIIGFFSGKLTKKNFLHKSIKYVSLFYLLIGIFYFGHFYLYLDLNIDKHKVLFGYYIIPFISTILGILLVRLIMFLRQNFITQLAFSNNIQGSKRILRK